MTEGEYSFWGSLQPAGYAFLVSAVLLFFAQRGNDFLLLACFPYAGVASLVSSGSLVFASVVWLLQLPAYCLLLRLGARNRRFGLAVGVVVVTHIFGMGVLNPNS
jgi:hypothetical protein